VLVESFPAQVFGTNCYIVAAAAGEQCVVIDPGIGVLDALDAVLAKHRLSPAAVLLSHGHLDHTFSVAPVCGARGITAYVHPDDAYMLADPAKALSTDITAMFGGRLPYTPPDDVAELVDGATVSIAGLDFVVDHAPGHTGGSVLFHLAATAVADGFDGPPEPLCFSGDVLFRDSIGRTDLPGGSMQQMVRSLREKILPLPDETVVLPGHGDATTIGRERARNPYLREARTFGQAPHRGL
jgi:hydroxyacylglutathione hydrolase